MNFRSPKLLALGLPMALMQCGAPQCAPAPAATMVVASVYDGDTLTLANGDHIRFIGIDTPELRPAMCGGLAARDYLRSLVQGRAVTIEAVPGRDDMSYDRLLRYVVLDGADVGQMMVDSGWAHARYDDRDGYQTHPREAAYVASDAAHAAPACGW